MAEETTTAPETAAATTAATTTTDTKAVETTATTETKAAETTDTKATETKAPETKTETKEAEKPAETKAEEAVDYAKAFAEVKLPEGVTLDPVVTGAASEIFGKHKVSADLAKDLTSFFVSQQQAAAEQNVKAWNKQQEDWKTAAGADKAITAELRADAKTVFSALSKESKELLEGYGFTNNPHLIKDFARFSAAIKDDSFVRGDAARGANGDARKQFPNSNMNP